MSATLQERQQFYVELTKNPSGYQDTLDSKFSELYNQLLAVGFIKNGIDGTLRKRYLVTDLGKEQINSFLIVYHL
jgi:hypothetical protein